MRTISRTLTVETQAGKLVTVRVNVSGTLDESSQSKKSWRISGVDIISWNSSIKLSQDEKNEVEKLVGERVDTETWNFDK